jgi:hypothetical protein
MTLARLPQVVEPRKHVGRKPDEPVGIRVALILEAEAMASNAAGEMAILILSGDMVAALSGRQAFTPYLSFCICKHHPRWGWGTGI